VNDRAARFVEVCLARGAAQAEAWIKMGSTREVSLEAGGAVSRARTAEGGVGVRVVTRDGRLGFASLCGPGQDAATMEALADAAIGAAQARWAAATEPMPSGPLPDGRGFGIFDPRLQAATPSDLEGLLDDAASEALRTTPQVRRLDAAAVSASCSDVWIANSAGLAGGYRQTRVRLTLGVVAALGTKSVVVRRARMARSLSAFSAALFGDETARLAAIAIEGTPPPPGPSPALLAPAAAAEVLRLVARTLGPDGPAEGTRLASARLTLIDDGRLPGGVATAPFDGEGVITRRTPIITRGVADRICHDRASAARHGTVSTGNGMRASFRDPPRRSSTNLFITPGSASPEEMLSGMGEGLWIQALHPTAALTPQDGTVVALASGRHVRNGAPGAPLAGALVILRVEDLMRGIESIGNDLTFGFPTGSFGSPSLLVSPVEVQGA
jgi:PmbA protein